MSAAVVQPIKPRDPPEERRSKSRAGLVVEELNYQRRSHRVNIPLVVEIDSKVYRAHDWSVDGIGIKDLGLPLNINDTVLARVVLPMPDAQVTVDVTLSFRGTHKDVYGFEFMDLGSNVRRMLRHYIELAVDGKLSNIEDLVSVATTPGVVSPIRDALTLTDLEREGILQQFKKKSLISITAGILFALTVIAVLFYNTTYRIATTGLVTGNLEQVTANGNGVVERLFVSPGAMVTDGSPLFLVRDPDDEQRLTELDKTIESVTRQIEEVRQQANTTRQVALRPAEQLMEQREHEFQRGKELYDQKILPFRDFALIEHQFHTAKLDLLNQKSRLEGDMQFRISNLEQQRRALQVEKEGVLARMDRGAVRSKVNGRIVRVEYQEGNYVTPNDPVVLVEKDTRPFVLLKLLSEDALKIRMGMPAEVYVPEADIDYQASVAAIGYAAADSRASLTMEASLNETLVRLDLADQNARLPANTRVRVWIKTI